MLISIFFFQQIPSVVSNVEANNIRQEEYDLCIIAPVKFSSILRTLIDHKNNYGIESFLITTEEIYQKYSGRDNAEQIKCFIQNAIEQYNIKYVLFVGDKNLIPIREILVSIPPLELFNVTFYTDNYYADIYDSIGNFCCWNIDDDQYWGEAIGYSINNITNIDNIDGYPDVGVGRLPCSNIFEVLLMMNKIIVYESSTYNMDWFKRIILMGGDTFPTSEEILEGEIITEKISTNMILKGFEPVKLYTSKNTFNPHLINAEISKGAGFISFSGHGLPYCLMTYPPYKEDPIYYNYIDMLGLSNFYKLPVVFLFACSTADPNGFLWNGFTYDCFAWSVVKKIFGGAIATIGQTTYGYIDVVNDEIVSGGDLIQLYFFESYNEELFLSDIFNAAQTKYLDRIGLDYFSVNEFILYGDPSLKIGGYE